MLVRGAGGRRSFDNRHVGWAAHEARLVHALSACVESMDVASWSVSRRRIPARVGPYGCPVRSVTAHFNEIDRPPSGFFVKNPPVRCAAHRRAPRTLL
ncbi:hypothetical protein I6G56_12720 [Burkholderia humptydooensis]|uniref:Uncharacterized protein n=1 Tax=Burkholderia humptydooensis TaxID=430531 RepID=A0A7T2WZZ6_9BURK|nr:hypothetical protein I6G56_12720 [Burkholderia humptydooensis]